jgi:hypothetical protein
MRVLAAAAALSLVLCACATQRPMEPTAPNHGLLIARARVRGALLPFTNDTADSAVVEQLDDDGEPVPGKIAVSGYCAEGAIYFMDLPRGRYALKSVSFPARGARYEVTLSSALFRPAAAELGDGAAAFLGALTLDGRFPDFDVAVDRALSLGERWAVPFLNWPPIERDAEVRSLDRTPTAERESLLAARADLASTQWRETVSARLREMGAAEPAARAGGVRNREIPLKQEVFFGWRDTLQWGPPARSKNGLSWRRPGGEARVAVFFTTASAPGFAGYDEALRQMRDAAGGLEDPAALYEVRVGGRFGQASRQTSYRYPEGTLVGSEVAVSVTETTLVPDPSGMYTARLRAPREEFEKILSAYREFLLQLSLERPKPAAGASQ